MNIGVKISRKLNPQIDGAATRSGGQWRMINEWTEKMSSGHLLVVYSFEKENRNAKIVICLEVRKKEETNGCSCFYPATV